MAEEIEEARMGDLTVRIDRLLCVGFGDCIEVAPDALLFDDEGIATFADGAEMGRATVLAACESCPVDAISAFDADGTPVAP